MPVAIRVQTGAYQDSVKLMRISAAGSARSNVEIAVAIMATETNLDNLVNAGFDPAVAADASPNDLILAARADTAEAAEAAIDAMKAMLSLAIASNGENYARPRTLRSALDQRPDSNLVLISVPGPHVRREAEAALNAGLHCMVFSDNVSVEDEIRLKLLADEKGLLLMGPDCGTALIGGKALAFANVVSTGPVGIVGASGTGIQAVSVLIDRLGSGVSHAIGTGGRDLSQAIGGRTMLKGIQMLGQDEATKVLLLVSKPPDTEVMKQVIQATSETKKPAVGIFLGGNADTAAGTGVHTAEDLEAAARAAVALACGERPPSGGAKDNAEWTPWIEEEHRQLALGQRFIRGLFSGGTLCDEAMLILGERLKRIHSNISLEKSLRLTDPNRSVGHTVVDLGEDFFTRGRPHPMIDPGIRNERILREAEDPETAVLLLDIVLGHGAHEDPAGSAAIAIRKAVKIASKAGRSLSVVAFVCGTEGDPQTLSVQEATLREAGVRVFPTNAQAARFSAALARILA